MGEGGWDHMSGGRGTGYTVEKREGAQSLFLPLDQGCGPLRGAGWGCLSQVWSLEGTRGLAAPIPPAVTQIVVLQGGLSREILTGEGSLPWLMPTCPQGQAGQTLLQRGIADPSFFRGRSWRGCSRGVSVWLRPVGVAWTPPSSASTCSAARSGDRSPRPLRSG